MIEAKFEEHMFAPPISRSFELHWWTISGSRGLSRDDKYKLPPIISTVKQVFLIYQFLKLNPMEELGVRIYATKVINILNYLIDCTVKSLLHEKPGFWWHELRSRYITVA